MPETPNSDTLRRLPSLEIHDYGAVFDVVAEHFVPGDSSTLIAPEAIADSRKVTTRLQNFGLPERVIKTMFSDATHEIRHVRAWLSILEPEDFCDPTKWP